MPNPNDQPPFTSRRAAASYARRAESQPRDGGHYDYCDGCAVYRYVAPDSSARPSTLQLCRDCAAAS